MGESAEIVEFIQRGVSPLRNAAREKGLDTPGRRRRRARKLARRPPDGREKVT